MRVAHRRSCEVRASLFCARIRNLRRKLPKCFSVVPSYRTACMISSHNASIPPIQDQWRAPVLEYYTTHKRILTVEWTASRHVHIVESTHKPTWCSLGTPPKLWLLPALVVSSVALALDCSCREFVVTSEEDTIISGSHAFI
jgi:hypothetical protein